MKNLFERLHDGRVAILAAAAWSLFDALVHVAVNQVEPLRIAGNVTVLVGAVLALTAVRSGGRLRVAAITCGIAAGLVLGFNAAWAVAENKLPVPAAIFITVAVVLAAWAARRFLVEAGQAAENGAVAARRL